MLIILRLSRISIWYCSVCCQDIRNECCIEKSYYGAYSLWMKMNEFMYDMCGRHLHIFHIFLLEFYIWLYVFAVVTTKHTKQYSHKNTPETSKIWLVQLTIHQESCVSIFYYCVYVCFGVISVRAWVFVYILYYHNATNNNNNKTIFFILFF